VRIPIHWAELSSAELLELITLAAQEDLRRWKEKTTDARRCPVVSDDHRAVESRGRGAQAPAASQADQFIHTYRATREAVKDEPTTEGRVNILERMTMQAEPPKPWALYSQQGSGKLMYQASGGLSGLPSGRFVTLGECQTALHGKLEGRIVQLRQQAASQRGIRVDVTDKPNYVAIEQRIRSGLITQPMRTESLCYLAEGDPS
jgi:hypothetical protein